MKILSLQAENIKRLTAIEIVPDGPLVQITGRNEAGKSSILDAIFWAISGAKHIQVEPIRMGATKARIKLDLGELVVERKFTRKDDMTYTTTLTVANAEGARFSSPQEMLNELLGALTFDPLAFARLAPKAQVETLKSLVPGLDFTDLDKANKADYDARTDLNRRAKEARAQAAGITVPADLPAEPVDEAALLTAMSEAARLAAATGDARAALTSMRNEIAAHTAEIERLKAMVAGLEKRAATAEAELAAFGPAVVVDIDGLRRQIEEARTTNAAIARRDQKKALEKQALDAEVAAGKLGKAIDDRTAEKARRVAEADMPVPGLGFGNDLVLLNGLPFEQASDAARLRTSVAIAMAMNPKLKVIRVRDGSLLDDDGIKILAEMAAAHDFQIWIERVDTSGKIGFVIEDGALKAHYAEAAE